MEPRIQYARTTDGVSIAFGTMGEGMPLVCMIGPPFSHVQLEWRLSDIRSWAERIGRGKRLIRYDPRGTGLSEGKVTDYSLDGYLRDLEAVVEHLGLRSFSLFAIHMAGMVAVSYAARHPERVSHLILWCSFARGADFIESPQIQGLQALAEKDWELYTETLAHARMGWTAGEEARLTAEYLRESTTPEAFRACFTEFRGSDVTPLLPQVKSPTLVLHRRQVPLPPVALSQGLASRIASARLTVLEGTSLYPFVGDVQSVVEAIDEFLGVGHEEARDAASHDVGAFRTILFTDIEGSTALTQRLGDAKARELLRKHERMVRDALQAHGGSEVKTMGDGFMASFSSATKALESAIAMQRAFAKHNESAEEPILVRVGLNAGEPIAEDEDLFGTAVNEAARITATAKGGKILVSNVVRQLAKGKDFFFSDRGETSLKGFDEPVRLFEVRWPK